MEPILVSTRHLLGSRGTLINALGFFHRAGLDHYAGVVVVTSVSHPTATRIRPAANRDSAANHIVPGATKALGPRERMHENTYFVRGLITTLPPFVQTEAERGLDQDLNLVVKIRLVEDLRAKLARRAPTIRCLILFLCQGVMDAIPIGPRTFLVAYTRSQARGTRPCHSRTTRTSGPV